MPAALEAEEIEEITALIEQDLPVKEIMDQTGRSRSTVFKVAKDAGLSLATSDSNTHNMPAKESDRVVYAATKGHVRQEATDTINDVYELGTLASTKYRRQAHEKGISVVEYLDRAVEFFNNEILMVETRKYVIEELEKENKQLRASLSVMGIVKDMAMTLMGQGHDIDFDNLMTAARAISAANQGVYEYVGNERSGIEPHGEEAGIDPRSIDGPGIESANTDDIEYTDDEPTSEEYLRGHEGSDGHEDDGEHDEPPELPEPGERGDEGDASHPEPAPGGQETGEPGATVHDDSGQSKTNDGHDSEQQRPRSRKLSG